MLANSLRGIVVFRISAFLFVYSVTNAILPAAFVLVDNFQGASLGTVNGQNGWVAPNANSIASFQVVVDPLDAENKALAATNNIAAAAYKPILIPQGTTATLFMRVLLPAGQKNISFGTTDVVAPSGTNFADFETQLNMNNATNTLSVRDGASFQALTQNPFSSSVWHNFWMVIDNTADTYSIYRNTASGVAATGADQLTTAGPLSSWGFRNGVAANDMVNILLQTTTTHNVPAYWDDFYIDTTGVNLANPIPEPSTLAIAGIAASFSMLGFRRMKRTSQPPL